MDDTDRITPQPPQRLNRVLHLLIVISFSLPFATVRSCRGDESEGSTYTGIQMFAEHGGGVLVAVLVFALLLFAVSFRRRVLTAVRQGMVSAFKALLCAFAVLMTFFATDITFMFSRVSLQIGFYICAASWLALHYFSMRSAIGHYSLLRSQCREEPPPWGIVVGILTVVVYAVTVWRSEPDGTVELVLGLFASALIGAPLVVLAILLAVRYRHRRTVSSS